MRWIFDISENYFHYKDMEEIADPSNLEIDDIIPFDKDLRYFLLYIYIYIYNFIYNQIKFYLNKVLILYIWLKKLSF